MGRTVIALSFGELTVEACKVGDDIAVLLYGGGRPHIGCTVLAVPRPSLKGDGAVSCTSSVINLTGHKDELMCREIAERLCRKYDRVCVCSGGFHKDDISEEEIKELMAALRNENIEIRDKEN